MRLFTTPATFLQNMTKASIQNFEASIAELESIVGKMESANLPLDESLRIYQRGVEILKSCQTSLNSAAQQVKILSEENQLNDFTALPED